MRCLRDDNPPRFILTKASAHTLLHLRLVIWGGEGSILIPILQLKIVLYLFNNESAS